MNSRHYSQNFTVKKHDEQFYVSGYCNFLGGLLGIAIISV